MGCTAVLYRPNYTSEKSVNSINTIVLQKSAQFLYINYVIVKAWNDMKLNNAEAEFGQQFNNHTSNFQKIKSYDLT